MATNASFKPIDPSRDEFRRYLERSGVIEALTKVVCRLLKEKNPPENPLEYLRTNLCDAKHQADEFAYLQKELAEARSEIQRLRQLIQTANPDALLEEKPNTINEDKAKVLQESAAFNESTSSQEANESSSSELEKIEENVNDTNKQLEDLKLN